jgi:excisionase family DNA binding protein
MASETERLLTADQLAERWQVRKRLVWNLTKSGDVPAVKLGRYYRYRLDAIEEFERRPKPAARW